MLSVQALKDWGANTQEGITRCMGNEAFYLRMVGMIKNDTHLEQMEEAAARHDLAAGFEAAHALKGVLANLALTPALTPAAQLTEMFRAREDADYQPLLRELRTQMTALREMLS
ncbi:MAG: Hpt domain-containing protein [Clostridia bacterium]|nr:Hpt domain-containing protein [Clostridia bacterium]